MISLCPPTAGPERRPGPELGPLNLQVAGPWESPPVRGWQHPCGQGNATCKGLPTPTSQLGDGATTVTLALGYRGSIQHRLV